jgi:hypothetical protein
VSLVPTGRLREGYSRIAGVVRTEVKEALFWLMEEEGLPSLSQAVGRALDEWYERDTGVHNPASRREGEDTGEEGERVLNPAGTRETSRSREMRSTRGREGGS